MKKQTAGPVVAAARERIATLDDEFFGEMVGVSQAIDELRKALDRVEACLDSRDFGKASTLGYGPVAETFIFLQRTLGGLQAICMEKEALVSEIAAKLGCAYEDALPHVEAIMESTHPLTEEQRRKARKSIPGIKARIRALTQQTTLPRRAASSSKRNV
jgi:hypothetical protein